MNARHFFSILCSLLAFALVGCKTGPDYAKPDVPVPGAWSTPLTGGTAAGAADVAQWWQYLDDPLLTSLVERAAERNLDLRYAEARLREARAARGIVASALLPQVGASASYTRLQNIEQDFSAAAGRSPVSGSLSLGPTGLSRNITIVGRNLSLSNTTSAAGTTNTLTASPGGSSGSVDRQADLFQAGLDASWELDVFGGNKRALEAADATIEAVNEQRRNVLVSLASEVALNYIELRGAQERLAILRRNIDAQQETVKLTQARFDSGLTSELDSVRAQALLESIRSQVPSLETAVSSSIHVLGVLLGQEPGALTEELSTPADMPAPPREIPVGIPSELLRRRPDIRASERELAAATARIGEAIADLFPKFSLTGGIGGQSGVLGSLLDNSGQSWSIGPSIRWPIFQGGAIRANIEVQNARQEQAAIVYEQSILNALADVENSLVGFINEQQRRAALEQAVAANQRAVQLANERYVNGLETFLNVLQAQQQLYQSQDLLLQSESFVLGNVVSLYKALGGGWEGELAGPTATTTETTTEVSTVALPAPQTATPSQQ